MNQREQVPSISLPAGETGVLHQLERYLSLGKQCRQFDTFLENVETHRHSVRASVFRKVRQEYEERKAALEKEWNELCDQLRDHLQQLLADRLNVHEESGRELERLEEMNLRILAGEFKEEDLAEEMLALGRRQDERAREIETIDGVLRLYVDSGLLQETPPVPSPAGEAEDAPLTGLAEMLSSLPQAENEAGSGEAPADQDESAHTPQTPVEEGPVADQHLSQGYVSGYLAATTGSRKGERFPLISSNITLGNSPGIDIRLSDPEINHLHARILYKDRKHFLENLDPMARTMVNGIQADIVELRNGDIIQLGNVGFRVEYDEISRAWKENGATAFRPESPRLSA